MLVVVVEIDWYWLINRLTTLLSLIAPSPIPASSPKYRIPYFLSPHPIPPHCATSLSKVNDRPDAYRTSHYGVGSIAQQETSKEESGS